MTKSKAITIAAIITLIFGSVAMGISANTQSSNNSTDAVAADLPATDLPATDAAQPVQTPVVQQVSNVLQAYEEDDHGGEDNNGGHDNDDGHRGSDHEEDD